VVFTSLPLYTILRVRLLRSFFTEKKTEQAVLSISNIFPQYRVHNKRVESMAHPRKAALVPSTQMLDNIQNDFFRKSSETLVELSSVGFD
jgi:hypothetical protein